MAAPHGLTSMDLQQRAGRDRRGAVVAAQAPIVERARGPDDAALVEGDGNVVVMDPKGTSVHEELLGRGCVWVCPVLSTIYIVIIQRSRVKPLPQLFRTTCPASSGGPLASARRRPQSAPRRRSPAGGIARVRERRPTKRCAVPPAAAPWRRRIAGAPCRHLGIARAGPPGGARSPGPATPRSLGTRRPRPPRMAAHGALPLRRLPGAEFNP